ncbi:cell division protein FtsQ/DivIB [Paraurantiacibacter namhicola]|uniref:Cell division protein FtsQ n=1 Tax=Paraurantiacibacter namhicola TaxID=645517 RepID=A0A1C7DAL8_9SPHN|nr:cell division protein FtsQ/DivIB [Paraurantiacibacter namhicola]ANU08540.1 cell division protein FtsQ [Paraurantiacibacter namhicola]
MAQTIRRKSTGVRRQARAQGTKRQVRKATKQTSSLFGALLRLLPFTEEQLHRIFLVLIIGGLLAAAYGVAAYAGLTAIAHKQYSTWVAGLGYKVSQVGTTGTERLNPRRVDDIVLGRKGRSMAEIDLDAVRADVMELSWVKDASVSRHLPGTIRVHVQEREPYAALRKPDRLVLIDVTGHALEPISAAAAKDMLVVEGPGAQAQVEALDRLLDAAPALRPQVKGAEWIGNRRWDLTFGSGQVLSLPRGEEKAAAALIDFARLDGTNRLIGGKVTAFDMRTPDRIYLRCPDCADKEQLDVTEGS